MNYRDISFSPPDITEEEVLEVSAALKSGWITTGPRTKLLEKNLAEYIGVNKTVCVNSATAAMELSLRLLGIGHGDEVITSAYTYTASAAVIEHTGAKIVLVDIDTESFEMDYNLLEKAITNKTKAIIPVDIGGIVCDYNKIFEIVEKKKSIFIPNNDRQKNIGRVTIIADAAHSIGAERNGKKSGTIADITCFSFHAVKNLTTAEGGAISWTKTFGMGDEEMYKEYMLLALHGQNKDALAKSKKGAWEYDIVYTGYKCNMTDILASVGLVQLKRYDGLLNKRFELIRHYERRLAGTSIKMEMHEGKHFKSCGHLLLTNIKGLNESSRNSVIEKMAEAGIATNVHYKPLPMFTAYKKLGFKIENYPVSFKRYENEITLPLHTLLTLEDVDYVCDNLIRIVGETL